MSIKQIDEISRQISGAMRILHKSPRKAVKKGVKEHIKGAGGIDGAEGVLADEFARDHGIYGAIQAGKQGRSDQRQREQQKILIDIPRGQVSCDLQFHAPP